MKKERRSREEGHNIDRNWETKEEDLTTMQDEKQGWGEGDGAAPL